MTDAQVTQLPLSLEPGLATRYGNLRECFAHCVYQRGVGRIAAELDVQRSNLCSMLAGDRHLDTDLVERYMVAFNDTTPARFLAAKYLQDPAMAQAAALAAIPDAVSMLANLMGAAGMPIGKKARR